MDRRGRAGRLSVTTGRGSTCWDSSSWALPLACCSPRSHCRPRRRTGGRIVRRCFTLACDYSPQHLSSRWRRSAGSCLSPGQSGMASSPTTPLCPNASSTGPLWVSHRPDPPPPTHQRSLTTVRVRHGRPLLLLLVLPRRHVLFLLGLRRRRLERERLETILLTAVPGLHLFRLVHVRNHVLLCHLLRARHSLRTRLQIRPTIRPRSQVDVSGQSTPPAHLPVASVSSTGPPFPPRPGRSSLRKSCTVWAAPRPSLRRTLASKDPSLIKTWR